MTPIKRRKKIIQVAGIRWHLKSLVPADFLNCDCWPLSMVMIEGRATENDRLRKMFSGSGLKPKKLEDEEKREAESQFQLLFKGIVKPSISRLGGGKAAYKWIKKNKLLHDRLLSEIVCLSYGITQSDFMRYPMRITKTFAETLFFASQKSGVEPWAMYAGSDDTPALFNPMRWDFNLTIHAYAAERQTEEEEKALAKMKSQRKGR